MSVTVNIPAVLYRQAREIADAGQISVDQVIASAFAEHLAAIERLRQRAARGNRDRFLDVLDKAPDAEPEAFDPI